MVKLSNYFHNAILLLCIGVAITSCQKEENTLYKRVYTPEEKKVLAEQLLNAAGTDIYYQGTVAERNIIEESNKYVPQSADYHREIGVPYLKRGYAHEAYKSYCKAVENDSLTWTGYMAYGWLYFYRDYEKALELTIRLDTMTPDFVDYPQSTSVDYMQGICNLELNNIEKAIHYLDKHLTYEIKSVGESSTGVMPFQMLAIAYYKNKDHKKAEYYFNQGVSYNPNIADIHYHRALNFLALQDTVSAKSSLKKAQDWFNKGSKNTRPYVEEFYAIYQEDLDALALKIEG